MIGDPREEEGKVTFKETLKDGRCTGSSMESTPRWNVASIRNVSSTWKTFLRIERKARGDNVGREWLNGRVATGGSKGVCTTLDRW